jgi:protein-S-isoprenylcysteine O-methyltransferase Ste14
VEPVILVYVLWLIWFLSWLASAMLDGRTRKLTVIQDVIYRLVTIVGAVTLLFGFLPDPGMDVRQKFWLPLSGPPGWVLAGVLGVALCFYWWSRIAIGFTLPGSAKPHAQFVETGPYRWVRHPIYLSLIVAAFATALVFGRPSSLAGAMLLTAAFVVKILIGENVLRSDSTAYDDYADRVPMLMPLPWHAHDRGDAPPRGQAAAGVPPVDFRKAPFGVPPSAAPSAPVAATPPVPQTAGPGTPKAVQLDLLLDDERDEPRATGEKTP